MRRKTPWFVPLRLSGIVTVWLLTISCISSSPVSAAPAASAGRHEATLLAVGDIMVHMPQLPAYYGATAHKYNLSPWFDRVQPIFHSGDWVIGNLETPLAGAELKYTGYPKFNAPAELADALYGAGMRLVSTANNHAMDRGFAGIQRTLQNLKAAGLTAVGTADSLAFSKRQIIIERNGIRMGFLAYTYGTNGIPVPPDKKFAVAVIDPVQMDKDIRGLRKAGADVVTVSLHFGTEYQRLPNEQQRKLVRSAVSSGADIVLGSHPHVVQPYDVIEIPAAQSTTGQRRRGVVIYSLGNFISNQTGDWKDVGLIFGVRVVKTNASNGTSATVWDRVTLTPTWLHIRTQNKLRYYSIIPMEPALKVRDNPVLTSSDYKHMLQLLSGINRHLHTYQKSSP